MLPTNADLVASREEYTSLLELAGAGYYSARAFRRGAARAGTKRTSPANAPVAAPPARSPLVWSPALGDS
jgi:hypothetical protein